MTVSAHFDGKVIVPDEPLDLPPNQALILQIRAVSGKDVSAPESSLDWIAANAVDSDALPVDLADRHDRYLYAVPPGTTSSRVATYFADTSFWIALSSKRDQFHSRAIAWNAIMVRSGSRIVTTEAVLWEWLNALADKTTRATAAEGYRRAHADEGVEVVPFDPELNVAAVNIFRSRSDKDWSGLVPKIETTS